VSEHESAKSGNPSGEGSQGSPSPKKRRHRRRSRGNASTKPASPNSASNLPTPPLENGRSGASGQNSKESQQSANPAQQRAKKPSAGNRHPYNRGGRGNAANKGRWRHTFAALDLGTNNCRLLVAKPVGEGFKVIDAFSRTVRLGEGLSKDGSLTQEAMDRAIEALKVCAQKMIRRGVTRAHCIATEACRTAHNGASFIERAEKETGLTLDVISTAQEARFAAAGCAPLLDRSCDKALVFDIGGGSTELIWLDLIPLRQGKSEPVIAAWTSIPFGVVTLAEQYHQKADYNGRAEIDVYREMVDLVRSTIDNFAEAEPFYTTFESGRAHLIGNSGTVTTLAAVHLGLRRYDRSRVDGVWVNSQEMTDLVKNLSEIGISGRAESPCIGEDRADLLLPGCAILTAIQEAWPSERMRVADRGLREGILLALMDKADLLEKTKGSRRRRRRGGKRNQKSKNSSTAPSGSAPAVEPSGE
jgi:exopolyphosphatase/guanosine-5'-triphosphate,3'-diphosphate pyrophosphatase